MMKYHITKVWPCEHFANVFSYLCSLYDEHVASLILNAWPWYIVRRGCASKERKSESWLDKAHCTMHYMGGCTSLGSVISVENGDGDMGN